MQRRILEMYNKNKLIVTAKSLIRAKGVHTSLMLQSLKGPIPSVKKMR